MANDTPSVEPHKVTLNYELDQQGNPRLQRPLPIAVRKGHKIRFERGSIPPTVKITISFTDPQFFSPSTFEEGGQDILVTDDLPHPTTYECGLRGADGEIIKSSLSGPDGGGDVQPGGLAVASSVGPGRTRR